MTVVTSNAPGNLFQNPYVSGDGKQTSGGFVETTATSGDSIELSEHAKAVLARANDTGTDISLDAQVRLQKRIDAFASKLSDFYQRNSIPVDEKTVFNIDASGNINVDTAYKKKFNEYLRDNPEDAAELKKIAKLSALQATQKTLELYYEEKKAANGDSKKEAVAEERYKLRTKKIGELKGTLTFENGKLTSAATEYVATLRSHEPYEIPKLQRTAA